MNIGKFKAIRSSSLASNERYVLFILNSYANENGECWPSVDIIAKGTGLNKRTVFRCLAELRAIGLVSLYENPNGKTNVYKIHYEKIHSDTQSRVTKRHGCHSVTDKYDTESPVSDTLSPKQRHSVMGGVTDSHCIYNEEVPNEDTSEETTEKRKGKNSIAPYWEQKTFEEVLEEVKDRPYLERMAYAVKAHPMVRDLYKDSFITAIDSIGYDIMDDFKAEAERRERAGEPLNDWHRGVLRGDWRYKDIILGHYQHMQNAEKHLFGEPIDPEAYREFGHYYDRVFPKFEKQIKDLFLDLPVRKKDPQWKDYFNRHGDGPWTYRKYTRS